MKTLYQQFLQEHLPRAPDVKPHAPPTHNPPFVTSAPVRQTSDKTLVEFYFGDDTRALRDDMLRRPNHYTPEQTAIVDAMTNKRPLPPGTTRQDVNAIVLRYCERTEQRKKREDIVRTVQRRFDDPTVERIVEAQRTADLAATFENQAFEKAIKII